MSRYLKKKSEQTARNLTIKIPVALHERIEKLKQRADQQEMNFDVDSAVIDALKKICQQVEKALQTPPTPTS